MVLVIYKLGTATDKMRAGSDVIVRYMTQLLVSMPLCQVHLMRNQGKNSTHNQHATNINGSTRTGNRVSCGYA